jgi:predicted acylesterase/phospholipase RssA
MEPETCNLKRFPGVESQVEDPNLKPETLNLKLASRETLHASRTQTWRARVRVLALLLLTVSACSCAIIAIQPPPNVPVRAGVHSATRANFTIGERERRDGMFIGLALSGGGSRATAFSTAVMLELQRLGLLEQVDVLSGVSGGGLAATAYALDGYEGLSFNADTLTRVAQDFQGAWVRAWFSPRNLLRYAFTDVTRSDTLIEVLDEALFHGATYADLNPSRPKLLLNTTNTSTGEAFVISDERFAELHSSLAEFGLARAVYLSAAYPDVLRPMTLQSYASSAHTPEVPGTPGPTLYDGGPVDNLGLLTLVEVLHTATRNEPVESVFPRGCLVMSVDATPRLPHQDKTPLPASTVLLNSHRRAVLAQLGIPSALQDRASFGTFSVGTGSCLFWHLALRQLPDDDLLGSTVAHIPTNFSLSAEHLSALKDAAVRLIEAGLASAHGSSPSTQAPTMTGR